MKNQSDYCLWRIWLIKALLVAMLGLSAMNVQAETDCTQVTQIPQTECEALLDLYHSTDGPNWFIKDTWNKTNTPCDWFGVTCEDEHVTELNLLVNGGTIPETISHLSRLQTLVLSDSQLTSLPESVGNLKNLQKINIKFNQLTSLPESIGNLSSLQTLNLGSNQLTSLPESIGNLSSLQTFKLGSNQLTSLPESLGNLSSLQYLNLWGNQLTNLPESFSNLSSLQWLYLSYNQLTKWPESINNLGRLQGLNLGGNQISNFPESLDNLNSLKVIDLTNSQLSSWPEFISDLSNLDSLSLSYNQLTSLPEFIGNLSKLGSLLLSDNQLTSLPESIGNLSRLEDIRLENNQLTSLPEFIGNLSSLNILGLDNNQLTSLPESIGNLSSLEIIALKNNQLTSLPKSFSNLSNLQWLFLDNNQLTSLPKSFGNLSSLQNLKLNDNQLCDLPLSIINLNLSPGHNSEELIPEGATFANNYLLISDPDLLDWVNQYDSDWESTQTSGGCDNLKIDCTQVTQIPQSECEALLDFYYNTDGPYWKNNKGWNETNTPCDWFGVSCEADNVTELSLSENRLSGTIPESFGNLSNLQRLELRNNQLTSLPQFFGNLNSLSSLLLANNNLTSLPESFGNLNNLWVLFLKNNELTSLPESFGNLSKLEVIDLSHNQLCDLPLSIIKLSPNEVTYFANNYLKIFAPDLLAWLNKYDRSSWARNQVGMCGDLQPYPISHDFGKLKSNQQDHQLFTITNTSDEISIHINTVTITGHHSVEFTQSINVDEQCTDKTLAPSEVCYEYISFIPNSTGEKQAQLAVNSNAPDYPQFNISLFGMVNDVVKPVKPTIDDGTPETVKPVEPTIDNGIPETVKPVVEPTIVETTEEIVEPEPVKPTIDNGIPETVKPVKPTIDDGTFETLESVEPTIDYGTPETVKPVESTIDDETPETVKPVEPTIDEEVEFPTTTTDAPIVHKSTQCPSDSILNRICNAQGRSIVELEIIEKGNLSNAVLEGILTNKGQVSNLTITKDGHLTGGIITGYIVSEGLMEDFEFQGASIIGGTLSGTIYNNSEIGGFFKNVQLAPNTHIIGGAIAGNIQGDCEAPAQLENVTLKANTQLSCVNQIPEPLTEDDEELPSETKESEEPSSETKDSEELPSETKDSEKLPSETTESEKLPSETTDSEELPSETTDLDELPSETTDSEKLPILESAIAVNANGEITKSKALFSGGIAINTGPFESSATVTLSDGVDIRGRIEIASEHHGQVVDSLVVVAYQQRRGTGDRGQGTGPLFLMLDENGDILPWDFDMGSLVIFQTVDAPAVVIDVPIYQGQLSATGLINIYFGYRLMDGTVIYSPQTLDVMLN